MLIDVDGRVARWLLIVARAEIRRFLRNGVRPPEALTDLAIQLERGGVRAPDRSREERLRELSRERKRRYKGRQHGEDIPLRKPGPTPMRRVS